MIDACYKTQQPPYDKNEDFPDHFAVEEAAVAFSWLIRIGSLTLCMHLRIFEKLSPGLMPHYLFNC